MGHQDQQSYQEKHEKENHVKNIQKTGTICIRYELARIRCSCQS